MEHFKMEKDGTATGKILGHKVNASIVATYGNPVCPVLRVNTESELFNRSFAVNWKTGQLVKEIFFTN